MSSKRYNNRSMINNASHNFDDQFRARSVEKIKHYSTAKLKYPTTEEMGKLNIITDTWKLGDRLYKYSYTHYGDVSLWWIIAWFNKKPTENDFKLGDEILIPFPLERIMKYFGDQ
jgi:hypothetical protein